MYSYIKNKLGALRNTLRARTLSKEAQEIYKDVLLNSAQGHGCYPHMKYGFHDPKANAAIKELIDAKLVKWVSAVIKQHKHNEEYVLVANNKVGIAIAKTYLNHYN